MLLKKKEQRFIRRYFLYLLLCLSIMACATDKTVVKEEPAFVPEESFAKANELISSGKYEEARKVLETVKSKDGSQEYALLARIRIADTYFDDEAYDEAVVEYESFLDLYPYSKYASYAQYKLAMSFFERMTTVDVGYSLAKKALDEFEKLQRVYPRNPYMDIIDNRIRACMNMLAEYEFYVGNFYYNKGSFNAAIGRFNGILKNYPASNKIPEVLYFTGLSYENLGQRDDALNTLTALINQFPSMKLSIEAKKLIASFDKKQ